MFGSRETERTPEFGQSHRMSQLSLLDGESALLFEELLLALHRTREPVAQIDRFGSELHKHQRGGETTSGNRDPRAARDGTAHAARFGRQQILAGGDGRNVARSATAREWGESCSLAPRRSSGS